MPSHFLRCVSFWIFSHLFLFYFFINLIYYCFYSLDVFFLFISHISADTVGFFSCVCVCVRSQCTPGLAWTLFARWHQTRCWCPEAALPSFTNSLLPPCWPGAVTAPASPAFSPSTYKMKTARSTAQPTNTSSAHPKTPWGCRDPTLL